jgi:hypothetical protein
MSKAAEHHERVAKQSPATAWSDLPGFFSSHLNNLLTHARGYNPVP